MWKHLQESAVMTQAEACAAGCLAFFCRFFTVAKERKLQFEKEQKEAKAAKEEKFREAAVKAIEEQAERKQREIEEKKAEAPHLNLAGHELSFQLNKRYLRIERAEAAERCRAAAAIQLQAAERGRRARKQLHEARIAEENAAIRVETALLEAWYSEDPLATWYEEAKPSGFGNDGSDYMDEDEVPVILNLY